MISALLALALGYLCAKDASSFGQLVQLLVLSAGCILAAVFRWGGDDGWFTIVITAFCTVFAASIFFPAVQPPGPRLHLVFIAGTVGCAVGIWISRRFNRWQ